jgi:hypothetical protein
MCEGHDTRANHGVYPYWEHATSALGQNVAASEAEGAGGGVRLWQAQAPA